jgi:putative ABC transport system permease protein
VNAALGRTLTPDEHQLGAPPAVVVSDRFWREQLGGTRDAIGKRLDVDGITLTVVGVMPPGFSFPNGTDLWGPAELVPDSSGRTAHNWKVVGRLKSGVSLAQARRDLDVIAAHLKAEYGSDDDAVAVNTMSLHDQLTGPVRGRLLLLMGAVGCVLLIVCLNLASALLARDRARSRDLAIRTALGADRQRLTRQLITESLLLALAGGIAGLWLAHVGARAIVALTPGSLPANLHVTLDLPVATFTFAISIATGLLFGLAPAIRASRVDPQRTLTAAGSRGATRGSGRMRGALVVGEVALAVILLSGAGLLLRSLARLLAIDPGFIPSGVVTVDVYPPPSKYQTPDAGVAYLDRLVAHVGQTPGAAAVGAISSIPFGLFFPDGGFRLDRGEDGYADYRVVAGDYFRAMHIPLVRGRLFNDRDRRGAPTGVIISQSLAHAYWPGEDPIGHRFRFFGMDPENPWLTVIGVVGDVRDQNLATAGAPTAYVFARQQPYRARWGMTLTVRTTRDANAMIPLLRQSIRDVDPDVPVQFSTMSAMVDRSSADRRFTAILLATFAAAALLLAAIGIYAVLAFSVVERSREIGIRMALGAQRRAVLQMIVGRGLGLTVTGLAIGVTLSFAATRLLSSLLYGIAPTDVPTYAGVSLLLATVAFVASYIPAHRATRVDPLVALRSE